MNKVKVFHINTHESFICDSLSHASKLTERPITSIHCVLTGKTKKSGNYWFTKDLTVEKMPVLAPDKRIIDKIYQTNTKKEIISTKVDKETAKLEYQKTPQINNKELEKLAHRVTYENGKRVLHLKPTVDEWTFPYQKIYETKNYE
jgi:hypothetical protein